MQCPFMCSRYFGTKCAKSVQSRAELVPSRILFHALVVEFIFDVCLIPTSKICRFNSVGDGYEEGGPMKSRRVCTA